MHIKISHKHGVARLDMKENYKGCGHPSRFDHLQSITPSKDSENLEKSLHFRARPKTNIECP